MKILLGEVMLEKDITYKHLAALTGVSKSTLHRIVGGQTSPTLDTLEKVARGLEIGIIDLFESEYKERK